MVTPSTAILKNITDPSDLKKLTIRELKDLSEEIRQFIIDVVSKNTGHLGASLGVIELTLALHYVFDTPADKIIWDVGHQAYAHKIITGRKELFHTNRNYKGISGFPRIDESKYDAFGGGHSSISISAALGMAMAHKLQGKEPKQFIAVIGDGSLTGGVAFEGLNNAGIQHTDLLVILNDNNMAIDPNVGAMKNYLINLTASYSYNKLKKDVWDLLSRFKLLSAFQRMIQKLINGIKSALFRQSNLFEALGFRYFGPVDGHDLPHLIKILNDLKKIPGPKLLHCITIKGKGYAPAELNQVEWHAPGKFDKRTGEIIKPVTNGDTPLTFQDVFGETLVELAHINPAIVGITPAMPTGCSMNRLMEEIPERAFDVGIAEQHAVTFSAGLAIQGMIPYCNIYSTFLQRAYDQVIHDVAIQRLPVIFCIDRAGIVGHDGPTHHGAYDIAALRCIPNLILAAPMDEIELRNMMFTAQKLLPGPFAIRYPRAQGIHSVWRNNFSLVPVGKARKLSDGTGTVVLSAGYPGNFVQKAIAMLNPDEPKPAHYDIRYIKPFDEELLHSICRNFNNIITIEDGSVIGGFGSALSEFVHINHYTVNITIMGIPDRYIEHGTPTELYADCGLDTTSIIKTIRKTFSGQQNQ